MPISERTPQRLVATSGSTTLTLDKESGRARLKRKLLFWSLRPAEAPLTEIADVTLESGVDRASGVELCSTTLVLRSGAGWLFPCTDKKDAEATVQGIREFLGLGS